MSRDPKTGEPAPVPVRMSIRPNTSDGAVTTPPRPSPPVAESSTLAASATSGAERRVAHRFKIFHPGQWRHADTHLRLHLLDISTTGARAFAKAPPEVGTNIFIECGVPLGVARVSWLRGSSFGVQFRISLSLDTIDAVADTNFGLKGKLKRLPVAR